jgi:hypothetical protein
MANAELFAAIALLLQAAAPEPVALVRAAAAQDLRRLPDYTCAMNIERLGRSKPSDRFDRLDSLRLEVALVAGEEMFAWPGSQSFASRSIFDFAPGGAISSGDFAGHARQVFLGNAIAIQYAGLDTLDGRKLHHFRFRAPLEVSRYLISDGRRSAIAAYEGDAWAEEDTFRLARLAVRVPDPPKELLVRGADNVIDYQIVRLEGVDRLLPSASELTLRDALGHESRNRTVFTGCRQYGSVSTLHFEEPAAGATPVAGLHEVQLPAGLDLKLRLQSAIDPGAASAGDAFQATLSEDVKEKGRTLAPRGARINGRILAVARVRGAVDGFQVVMRLESASWEGATAKLRAELIAPLSGSWLGVYAYRQRPLPVRPGSDVGVLQVHRGAKWLSSGFPMTWRTLDFSGGPQP